MNYFDLTGKKAIVTGASRGLGYGMAEGLCEMGASVALVASSERVDEAASRLRSKGYDAHAVREDISTRAGVDRAFDNALAALGGDVDILVNNAGIQRREVCEEFTYEDWKAVTTMNLDTVFLFCQRAGRVMLAKGQGKIINLASMLSFFGGYTVPAYAASKGGVAQLTKALSNEWAGRGVCVNAIAPGYMDTDMNVNLLNDENRYKEITARIPKGRWGTPDDMKGIVVFLASEASDYINGAIIPVDGGYLGK